MRIKPANQPLTVRPKEAAQMLGVGLSTFWLRVKTDPDFPQLIKLSPKVCVVRIADLEAYVTGKAEGAK
jgi:predicted DNA-binding transcriptional regulator AlpA